MSQTTTPVVPIRPTAAVAPQSWPAGPYPACPPDAFSAMARLMSCYEDVRLATEFLSKVMTDIIEHNPAVTTAIVEAIQKAGSNLPTIGVTDGSNAQPGQVGEYISFNSGNFTFGAAAQSQTISLGILPPGDWDCWAWADVQSPYTYISIQLSPVPAGFSHNMIGVSSALTQDDSVPICPTARALTSVPSPIVMQFNSNSFTPGPGSSNVTLVFNARRRR